MADTSLMAIASQYGKSVASVQTLVALGFTQAQIDSADALQLAAETASVRYTYDGTAATSSVGYPLVAGGTVTIQGNGLIRNLQIIGAGATVDATLQRRY
jgi:hypothetical protein